MYYIERLGVIVTKVWIISSDALSLEAAYCRQKGKHNKIVKVC